MSEADAHPGPDAPSPSVIDGWRAGLAAARLPGSGDLGGDTLELTHAHPSGLASLLAGRPARLSSLVREAAAHAEARRRARAIRSAAEELAAERGVPAGYLAAGVATWQRPPSPGPLWAEEDLLDGPLVAPVLLRGCTLRPRGAGHDDYELVLDDVAVVNPELVRGLQAGYGVRLDPQALAGMAFGVDGFDPRPVYAYLEELCADVPRFRLEGRLVVGSFTPGSGWLLADLDAAAPALAAHPLLGRLVAREVHLDPEAPPVPPGAGGALKPVRPLTFPDRDPRTELSVLDLDPAQRRVVDAAASGESLAVEGPPGSGLTHTVAASIGALVARGRRVLVLTPHRASADLLLARLDEAGLRDAVLDLHDGLGHRPQVLASLGARLDAAVAPPAAQDARRSGSLDDVVAALASARAALAAGSEALHDVRSPWGVSAYEAMVALAALMARDNPPHTRVRLPQEVCRQLDAGARERLRADLHEAAELGAFTQSRLDTRWLDARLADESQARAAVSAARAARAGLPAARRGMDEVARASGLTPAVSVSMWRPQLELLVGIRDTLDVLLPAVYEQDLGELVAGTAPDAAERIEGGWLARRALRRRARTLVRPGVHVADLHGVLVRASEQGERWKHFAEGGGWPRVPTGLAQAEAAAAAVDANLAVLTRVLAGTGSPELAGLSLDSLESRLGDLAIDEAGALAQPRRCVLLATLTAAGLGDLIADLRTRRAVAEDVDGELDLAWWTSVLESVIRGDPRLARHEATSALVEDLADADRRLIAQGTAQALAAIEQRAHAVAAAHADQVKWLRAEVHRAHRSAWPGDLFRRAADLVGALKPIWIMSPDAVARCLPVPVPGPPLVDVVVVDDAGQVGLAEAAASIARGRQLLVAGDRRRLPPATGRPSVLEAVIAVVGVRRLDRDHRTRDGRLIAPLLACYPEGWAGTPGSGPSTPLTLEHVQDGMGIPAPGEENVVSAQAEVMRVVDLVAEHAARRPGESLLVVTLGARHAARIEDALRAAVPDRPELARWLEVHWAGDIGEPFAVRPVHRIAGLERDAVIVSIGIARTPHGRVLHRFGVLDGRFGGACLIAALSRARRRTTLVCCFTADDLSVDRVRTDGARMLRDVLTHLRDPAPPALVAPPDALVADLRDRLTAAGLPVRVGVPAADRPLDLVVADLEEPARMRLAIDVDGPAHATCPSVRVRERQRREAFARAGWSYVRVAAMDLFCDPAAEVDRIRQAWYAAGAGWPTTTPSTGIIIGRPRMREEWPDVVRGQPVAAYGDEELDAVAGWVLSDGVNRSQDEVAVEIREALQLVRRGPRADEPVLNAAARALHLSAQVIV